MLTFTDFIISRKSCFLITVVLAKGNIVVSYLNFRDIWQYKNLWVGSCINFILICITLSRKDDCLDLYQKNDIVVIARNIMEAVPSVH